jgi:hypothetical protein
MRHPSPNSVSSVSGTSDDKKLFQNQEVINGNDLVYYVKG